MDTEKTPPNAAPPELAPDLLPPPPQPPEALSPAELLDAQYQGPKAALRPIYEALAYLAAEAGRQVRPRIEPGAVVFERKGIAFAVVKASTKTRVDLGLALPGHKPQAPFRTARRFAGVERITHRMELLSLADVDGLLVQWMAEAFELAKPVKQKALPPPEPAAPQTEKSKRKAAARK